MAEYAGEGIYIAPVVKWISLDASDVAFWVRVLAGAPR